MRLPDDPEVRAALTLAMRRLATRDRFSGELASEFRSQGVSEDGAERAIAWLQANGLLDEGRAIESYLRSRADRRSLGRNRLREELMRRGAPEAAVDAALAEIDDDAEFSAMRAALDAKIWRPGDRMRAARFLQGRGFDPELIESALDSRFGETSD